MIAFGTVAAAGSHVTIEFGANGVGGHCNSNLGDGACELAIDLDGDGDGDGTFDTRRHFYRLLGDVTGEKTVDAADLAALDNSFTADLDTNGDGRAAVRGA